MTIVSKYQPLIDECHIAFSVPGKKYHIIMTSEVDSVKTFSELVNAHGYGVTEHEGVLYVRKSKFSQP